MTTPPTDPQQQNLLDLQSALRALWPDRPVVYFDEVAVGSLGEGPVLTDEERAQLHRVADAIAEARSRSARRLLDGMTAPEEGSR